jgi:hypothetical protein
VAIMLMQTDPFLGLDRFNPRPRKTPPHSAVPPTNASPESEQRVVEFDSPAIAIGRGDAAEATAA